MTVIDIIVLAIVGVSVVIGVWRGLVREVLALVAWAGAFLLANLLAPEAAKLLPRGMASEEIRLLVSFVVMFIVALIGLSVLAILASKLVKVVGLGSADRAVGGVFGLTRGLLVVLILALLAGLTTVPREPAWRNAALRGPLEAAAETVKAWLPADFSKRIKF
ncbi:MAG TPA: CvpA family protein [Burkholderiales bacterium]|nr:CvpA family protein [Burkholderiales bacterium]